MSWNSITFLLAYDWPYLLVVAALGLVIGWRSFAPPRS